MQEVVRIYTILSFFIYITLCSVVYMLSKEILEKRHEEKIEKLKTTFGFEVQRQIETLKANKRLSKLDIDYVKSKVTKRYYFTVFNDIIIQLNKDKLNMEYIRLYISYFEDEILKVIKKYGKREDIKKTFIVKLIGEYGLNNYEINEFLFDCLKSKSIYLRFETLNTFSKLGNTRNLIRALEFISDEGLYVNSKILIDVLDNFNGDFENLDKHLLSKFDKFNDSIKKDIIEHLKNKNVEFAKDKIIDILKDENSNKEVRISAIKYFSKIHYTYAKKEIKNLLNHKEWEYRAISASTLSKYKEKDVIEGLLDSITDYNWYVRYNSAISLLSFNEPNIIDRVIGKNDKYSIDILLYAMLNQGKISYEYYLERIEKLEVNHAC